MSKGYVTKPAWRKGHARRLWAGDRGGFDTGSQGLTRNAVQAMQRAYQRGPQVPADNNASERGTSGAAASSTHDQGAGHGIQ
jgi:hypothetical protein